MLTVAVQEYIAGVRPVFGERIKRTVGALIELGPVSYTHLTLPTTPYV